MNIKKGSVIKITQLTSGVITEIEEEKHATFSLKNALDNIADEVTQKGIKSLSIIIDIQ